MSQSIASDPSAQFGMPSNNSAPAPAKLRVWPAVVILVLFWAALFANLSSTLAMFEHFMYQLAAYGVALVAFLGWWLTRRAVSWRDRIGAIVAMLLFGLVTWIVADKSFSAFGIFMSALPLVLTGWVIWLIVARWLSPQVRRVGFCVVLLAAFGWIGLHRFDGLEASMAGDTSWRWQPTKEQLYLESRATTAREATSQTTTAAWKPQPGDSLELRGPQRDGVLTGVSLGGDWEKQPPKLIWREKVGPGWAGMIVVDGHLVTQEQRGENEAVVCYDAATGKELWVHEDKARFKEDLAGVGPRGTPTFADGRIYALGATGILNCLSAADGSVIWSHDVVADAGVKTDELPPFGYAISPLVVDGLVVVWAGGTADKSVLAYRVADGEFAWSCPGGKHTYSSPQVVTLGGQKQIIMLDNKVLQGIRIADGTVLWQEPTVKEMSMPMLQPHLTEDGDLVVAMEPGFVRVQVTHDGDKWSINERWTSNALRPGFNDFVIHKNVIYGLNDGVLCGLDVATGKSLWKKGRLGHGQVLLLPDKDELLISSDTGEIILVSVDRDGYKELGRFQAIEGRTWNGPVIASGRLYLRNGEEMAAFELGLQ